MELVLVEALLPRHERVVDFDRSGADLDCPLHALQADTCIRVTAPAVQRLGRRIVDTHTETQAIEAASARFALGMGRERGANTASPVLRPNRDILKFRWIRQREMGVPEWLALQPSNEINPVTLVQARQAEDPPDRFALTWIERTDLVLHWHRLPVLGHQRTRLELPVQVGCVRFWVAPCLPSRTDRDRLLLRSGQLWSQLPAVYLAPRQAQSEVRRLGASPSRRSHR